MGRAGIEGHTQSWARSSETAKRSKESASSAVCPLTGAGRSSASSSRRAGAVCRASARENVLSEPLEVNDITRLWGKRKAKVI